jgi:hypothetical protein
LRYEKPREKLKQAGWQASQQPSCSVTRLKEEQQDSQKQEETNWTKASTVSSAKTVAS